MPRLVAAPDKFRGTATARVVADAIADGAALAGWSASTRPMSDGGEGFVDVLGGRARVTSVHGPLGAPVAARWRVRSDGTALLESAEAAGRALLPAPRGDDPVAASTYGVGELLAAALRHGATALVVGCGGTATTDGGLGCVQALEDLGVVVDVPLTVACDVDVGFVEAAARFGPQKGATPAQVAALASRLDDVARGYREHLGVDVTAVAGAGAAGGLAGGLVALGGHVVDGATYVAEAIGLARALDGADLVVTGEGRLDAGTLEGKVVARVLWLRPTLDAAVVAGEVDDAVVDTLRAGRPGALTVTALDPVTQRGRGTASAISECVAALLRSRA